MTGAGAARPPRPLPPLPEDAHKGVAGRVLCLAGSADMPGALVLAAGAAARAGAGLVTVAVRDPSQVAPLVTRCPEAVLLRLPEDETGPGAFDAAFEEGRFHARLLGPGCGTGPWTQGALEACLDRAGDEPLVLDADGLNAVAPEPERLARHRGALVLTPHPGEAARLLGREIPGDDPGRAEAARELARRAGAVVCLKGPRTVITDGERVHVNSSGNAGLATGGAGDVLSGIVLAYLATTRTYAPDLDALDAARLAVWVHGVAGDLAAAALGPRAVVASDLLEHLPAAQRRAEAAAEPE